MRFHMLHNIDTALHFLRCKGVKLVNIRSEDIVDGNPKLTLGLIWTIILHFQVRFNLRHRFTPGGVNRCELNLFADYEWRN